jgi:hypothetical protein
MNRIDYDYDDDDEHEAGAFGKAWTGERHHHHGPR